MSGYLPEDASKFPAKPLSAHENAAYQEILGGFHQSAQEAPTAPPKVGLNARGRRALWGGAAVLLVGGAIFGTYSYSQAETANAEKIRIQADLRKAEMVHEIALAELALKTPKADKPLTMEAAYNPVNATAAHNEDEGGTTLGSTAALGLLATLGAVAIFRKKKPES